MLMMFILMIFMMCMMLLSNNMKFNSKMEVECGMYNFSLKNSSSSMYILFLMVFLIFDLEITLFLLMIKKNTSFIFFLSSLIIMFSLIMELFESSLKWND